MCASHSWAKSTKVRDLASTDLSRITPPIVPTTLGTILREKRRVSSKGKKQKISASKQIVDAISIIATTLKDRAATLNDISAQLLSLKEVQRHENFQNQYMVLVLVFL